MADADAEKLEADCAAFQGLVFKTHRLFNHLTLGLIVMIKKKKCSDRTSNLFFFFTRKPRVE
jgi:hypothetical protein